LLFLFQSDIQHRCSTVLLLFIILFFLQQGADAESSMKTKEMERQKWIQELGKEIK
jgi:uncharacterized membrane protein affecting hemolysin expression